MEDVAAAENEDEVQKKHRQERKVLQSKIQALKKTAPKGDKKRKKEVAEEIAKLERELDDRHNRELEVLQEPPAGEELPSNVASAEEEEEQERGKVSRAQRRRNKKLLEEVDRNERITQQEVCNKSGPRVIELNSIKEALKDVGLQLHNIPADGNCLYCAVNHQLEMTGREGSSVAKLRKLTADFMRKNRDEFIPFMYNESDEAVTGEQFEEYCHDVESTKFWGGQMELRALSNALQCPIKVIQASGPTTLQGENFTGPALTITYHRHLYRLGEHYNSTVTAVADKINEEDDL